MIDIHVPVFDFFIYTFIFAILFFLFGYGNTLINNTRGFTKEQVDTMEETLRKITEYSYVEVDYDPAHRVPQVGFQLHDQKPPKRDPAS